MASFKVIHEKGKYHDEESYKDVIRYATSPQKVRDGGVIGGSVVPQIAAEAMEAVTKAYHKNDGVKLRHSILSFDSAEKMTFEKMKAVAHPIMDFYANDFQIMCAIHEDRDHLHFHVIMNTANYNDGTKYRGTKKDYYDFLSHMDAVLYSCECQ